MYSSIYTNIIVDMKLSTFLVWIVFYYSSVVILGINCINLGLISPIEVVEEWGCHDSEIRLTCGRLDSKLAILEATFTPNCTNEVCLRFDIKRLTRAFHTTQKSNSKLSRQDESEAGRNFLDVLKNADHLPGESEDEVVVIGSETFTEIPNNVHESGANNSANLVTEQLKARKASLRASLEKLIIRYLRKLAPNENFEMHKRSIRSKRNIIQKRSRRLTKSNEAKSNILDINIVNPFNIRHNESNVENINFVNGISRVSENANLRINFGERIIIVNETDSEQQEFEDRKKTETRHFCPEQRRKVSSLDRFDIERSYRNESMEDYNIRRLLNRRCSGKNHCSFIFNNDHPFSKVWESGIVRIKYVCMEDFRINHYCGEHLDIGYELTSEAQLEQHGSTSLNSAGESFTEARVVRESSARDHTSAYHSVKILRADDNLDVLTNLELQRFSNPKPSTIGSSTLSESRKRKIKIHNPIIEKSEVKEKSVYSQDFRLLKIIPSNIADINNLDKVVDQIYIRKDHVEDISSAEIQTSTLESNSVNNFQSISPVINTTDQQTLKKLSHTQTHESSNHSTILYYPATNYGEILSNKEFKVNNSSLNLTDTDPNFFKMNTSKFENYTITIREGDQYVIVFTTKATSTHSTPILKSVIFPPDNLVKPKDKIKPINQTIDFNTTRTLTETETSSIISTTFLTSETTNQIENKSFLATTVSIDYSKDLSNSISTNSTNVTTDMESSTSESFLDQFGGIFGISTHVTIPSPNLKFGAVIDDKEMVENETESTVSSTFSSFSTKLVQLSGQSISDNKMKNKENKPISIELPDSTVYDEDVESSVFSSFEDENDDNDDNDNYDEIHETIPSKITYTSIQKTVFQKPLLHGFIMSPGYPKYYIGEINCNWEIFAPKEHKIRLSVLDVSLRNAEPTCMDFIEIIDQGTSKILFNTCSEELRPIEIISESNKIQVIVKTKTKFAYPKRGVLLHYSALGCVDPPLPSDGKLVKKTETTNYYECKKGYIFPDTFISTRQLVCTERHTWNHILPDCVEELLIAQSGVILDSYNFNSRKRLLDKEPIDKYYVNQNLLKLIYKDSTNMPDKDADMVFDIIIPTLLIAGLLIVNGFVFAVIIYFRKRNKMDSNNVELAEL